MNQYVKFEFNKLVRDKLPARMTAQGVKVHSKTLTPEEYVEKLKLKLLEEANEVIESLEAFSNMLNNKASNSQINQDLNKSDNIETSKLFLTIELADLQEVITAIAKLAQISTAEIKKAALDKKQTNGVFTPASYIDFIEVDSANEKVINYLLDKNRPYNYSASHRAKGTKKQI